MLPRLPDVDNQTRPPLAEPSESWLLRTGVSVCVWVLAGVATVLAASGQIEFAHWVGITDLRAYAVPAVLELVAVAFLLLGYRRARRGDSPAALWLLATAIGAFAVYTNVTHSGRAGLVFGAASAITLILWFVKLRDDYRHYQRHTGQATQPRPKFGALWLVAPRLSARAWVIATRRRISTVDISVALAEVWLAVYEDSRNARIGRRLARRTAWRSVAEASGGVWAELPRTAQVASVDVVARPAVDPTTEPAMVAPEPARTTAAAIDVPQRRLHAVVGPTGRGTLTERVHAFLDEQVSPEDYAQLDEADDAYLLWTAARALQVDVEEITEDVRAWRRRATAQARRPMIAQAMP
jgi:hypothetical protein